MLVEPSDVTADVSAEVGFMHGNRHSPREFRFECAEESLDDGDAVVLPDRAVAWRLDAVALHPCSKGAAVEDGVAITDDVLGPALAE